MDDFLDELKSLSEGCHYDGSDLHIGQLVRDRFIAGLSNKQLQTFLTKKCHSDSTLLKVLEVAKGYPSRRTKVSESNTCPNCPITYKHKSDLNKHIRKHHLDHVEDLHSCLVCNKKFTSQLAVKVHERRAHFSDEDKNALPFKCPHCTKLFSKQKCVVRHCKVKHQDQYKTLFNCKLCGKTYLSSHALEVHLNLVHKNEEEIKMEIVEEPLEVTTSVKPTNNKLQLCDFCGKWVKNPKDHFLDAHVEEKPFDCDKCDFKHARKKGLKLHIKKKHGAQPHGCELCDYKSTSKYNLTEHVQMVHEQLRPHSCAICHKSFAKKSSMEEHVRVIHDQVEYVCHLCNESFKRRKNLSVHIRTFHEGKWYECSECDKKFTQKCDLKYHNNFVHLKEFDFTCEICDMNFRRQSLFEAHKFSTH